jgi:hypothetical protein
MVPTNWRAHRDQEHHEVELGLSASKASVVSAFRQAKYRRRRDAGMAVISLEVDPELLAAVLNRVGIRVTQDRSDLARGVSDLLLDLVLRSSALRPWATTHPLGRIDSSQCVTGRPPMSGAEMIYKRRDDAKLSH